MHTFSSVYLEKGQMGSALTGSLQTSGFVRQRDFLGTPVNLLLYSQKCQAYLFPQSVKFMTFAAAPLIGVDPICPQPSIS